MSLHKEISFEDEICEHLAAHGWLYAEGDAANYDRARALFPADVLAWVQATQPKAWEALDQEPRRQAARDAARPPARAARPARHARRAAPRHRAARAAADR